MPLELLTYKKLPTQRHQTGDRTRNYAQSYYVLTNQRNADPSELRTLVSAIIPTAWATDTESRLAGIDLSQLQEQRAAWIAEASYSLQGDGDSDDPFSKRRELSMSWARSTKLIDRDIHGDLMLNRAGDPIILEEDDVRQEIRLKWNAASVSPAVAREYSKAVNSDTWFGLDPWTAKCTGLAGDEVVTSTGVVYVAVTATIEVNEDTWKRRPLNRGTHTVRRDNGVIQVNRNGARFRDPIKDSDGNPIEDFLNEDGTAVLAPGQPPIVLEFETLRALPFNAFFPNS